MLGWLRELFTFQSGSILIPSSIIPYFSLFTRTIFVDPIFLLYFLRIFDKSLRRRFLLIPLYKAFVDPPGFLLYQRSTAILTAAVSRCFIGSTSTDYSTFLILPKTKNISFPNLLPKIQRLIRTPSLFDNFIIIYDIFC